MGAKAVGDSSVVTGILLLSPFVVITIIALLRHITPVASTTSDGNFLTGVLVAMSNYMGWNSLHHR